MHDDLAKLEAARDQLLRQLAELESAIKLIRQYRGMETRPLTLASPSVEFADVSGRDAARVLLTEAGDAGLHYRDLADAAVARGYRSDNASPKAIRDAFGRMLRKYPGEFERLERGRYRLKGRRK